MFAYNIKIELIKLVFSFNPVNLLQDPPSNIRIARHIIVLQIKFVSRSNHSFHSWIIRKHSKLLSLFYIHLYARIVILLKLANFLFRTYLISNNTFSHVVFSKTRISSMFKEIYREHDLNNAHFSIKTQS